MRAFKEIKSADEKLNFFDIHYNFIDEQRLKKRKNGELQHKEQV